MKLKDMQLEDIKISLFKNESTNDMLTTEIIEKLLQQYINPFKTNCYTKIYVNTMLSDYLNKLQKIKKHEKILIKEAFLSGVFSSQCLQGNVDEKIFEGMANLYLLKLLNKNKKT